MNPKSDNFVIVNKLDSSNLPRKNIQQIPKINPISQSNNLNQRNYSNINRNIVKPVNILNNVNKNQIPSKNISVNPLTSNSTNNIAKINNLSILNKKLLLKQNQEKLLLNNNNEQNAIDGLHESFSNDKIFRMLTYFIVCYIIFAILFFPNYSTKGTAVLLALLWLVIDLIRLSFRKINNRDINGLIMSASLLMEIGIIVYTIFTIIYSYKQYKKWKKKEENNHLSITDYIKYTFLK